MDYNISDFKNLLLDLDIGMSYEQQHQAHAMEAIRRKRAADKHNGTTNHNHSDHGTEQISAVNIQFIVLFAT